MPPKSILLLLAVALHLSGTVVSSVYLPGYTPQYNITRFLGGQPDQFRPNNVSVDCTNMDQFCASIVNATTIYETGALLRSNCRCACNKNAPIFNQYLRLCQDVFVSECANTVSFRQTAGMPSYYAAHAIFLPLTGGIVNSMAPLEWAAAHVTPSSSNHVNCRLAQMALLTEQGWAPYNIGAMEQAPFELVNMTKETSLKWLGFAAYSTADLLQGKLIKLTMRCPPTAADAQYCLVFAVIGSDSSYEEADLAQLIGAGAKATPVLAGDGQESTEKNRVIIIICAILLALTVVGTLMLWIVCWRFHKDRLARKIANQLICQQQSSYYSPVRPAPPPPSQIALNEASRLHSDGLPLTMIDIHPTMADYHPQMYHQHPQSSGPGQPAPNAQMHQQYNTHAYRPSMTNGDLRQTIQLDPARLAYERYQQQQQYRGVGPPPPVPPPPYPTMMARKKLYFSAEFFEPQMMHQPPDVANEFLYEVRRMIDMAKSRIRQRRFMPALGDIEEEMASQASGSGRSSRSTASTYKRHEVEEEGIEQSREMVDETSGGEAQSPNQSSPRTADSGYADASSSGSPHKHGLSSTESTPTNEQPQAGSSNATASTKVSQWLQRMPTQSEASSPPLPLPSSSPPTAMDNSSSTAVDRSLPTLRPHAKLLRYWNAASSATNGVGVGVKVEPGAPVGVDRPPLDAVKSAALLRRYGLASSPTNENGRVHPAPPTTPPSGADGARSPSAFMQKSMPRLRTPYVRPKLTTLGSADTGDRREVTPSHFIV